MRFVLMSYDGCLLPWAMVLQEEGYDVIMVIPKESDIPHTVGEGIVPISRKIVYDSEAIYVFDSNMGAAWSVAEHLKSSGYPVLGGGRINGELERDRSLAVEIMTSLGLQAPTTYEFSSPAEALEFLDSEEARDRSWVWKPERDAESNFSFVDPDVNRLRAFLSYVSKKYPKSPGILQEYVEGVTFAPSLWWNGEEITHWWGLVEDKKFRHRGVGPNTGCELSCVWLMKEPPDFLDVESLRKFLYDEEVSPGEMDITVQVSRDGDVYFLETNPRYGWDMDVTYIPLLHEGGTSLGEVLVEKSSGGSVDIDTGLYAVSVRLSVPPYPYVPGKGDSGAKGVPVFVDEEYLNSRIFLYDGRKDGDHIVLADNYGLVGVAVGVGPTPEDAVEDLSNTLEHVHVPDLSYRADWEDFLEDVRFVAQKFPPKEAGRGGRTD
ncbi:MAG: hypothetical protein NZ902_06605 [Acidilobaceae archaeon]|nr:hypothetical protein [Acidilobaceae archaeon]